MPKFFPDRHNADLISEPAGCWVPFLFMRLSLLCPPFASALHFLKLFRSVTLPIITLSILSWPGQFTPILGRKSWVWLWFWMDIFLFLWPPIIYALSSVGHIIFSFSFWFGKFIFCIHAQLCLCDFVFPALDRYYFYNAFSSFANIPSLLTLTLGCISILLVSFHFFKYGEM